MDSPHLSLAACTLTAVFTLYGAVSADDAPDVDWDSKYAQLLRERPDIRRKVESGGATRQQVIQWLMNGGEARESTRRYYGVNVEFKDPAEYRQLQEEVVYSGPQPGERLPDFMVRGFRGEHAGEDFDPVAAADGKPLVLIFQDNSVTGLKGLLLCGKALARLAEQSPNGLHISTTFLVDDLTPGLLFENDFSEKIDDVIEMSVSRDGLEGPGIYGLNRNVAMTIIIARDSTVLHNFALAQPMLYPDPHVFGAIAEAIEVDRETVAGWFNEPPEEAGD